MRAQTNPHEHQAAILKALAHPFRLRLLCELAREEECVCHLAALFGKPQPYVSQQLGELKDAGFLLDRRDGHRTYYRLADDRVVPLLALIEEIAGAPAAVPEAPRESICDCPRPDYA